ncbi:MAG: phospholipase A [Gammaproteobacteria bacterium]|nr:phospholipase A [Gammaproteobacteria bacterium]MBU1775688.1 phospholipase A [Gammaproteobacteria bacterium]
MRKHLAIPILCVFFSSSAHAETNAMEACSGIVNRYDRLKCYDMAAILKPAPRSYLTRAWDLDGQGNPDADGIRRLEPYRKNYALIRYTTNINVTPASPSPNHAATIPFPYQNIETKFQFSAKSEIGNYRDLELLGFRNFRLWGAFTQQAYWQAFNVGNSSPFRESNYEPEIIGTFGTGNMQGWKLLNVGFSHQSNGRSEPASRSWNRFYLQGGWEWQDIHVMGRGWWRLPEQAAKDDNPDISNYAGRAELVVHWLPDRDDEIILLLRSNLDAHGHKGFMQLDWASPFNIGRSSQLNFQLTTGYADSLIDYNHWQTTFSIGIVFKEW